MMTVTEAAAILGISERAIRYRLERGLMAGERAGKWIWLIPKEEVERVKGAPPILGRKPGRRPPPSEDG
jgi:excisionase family DNA binding protein